MRFRSLILGSIATIVILLSAQLAYVLIASYIGQAASNSTLIGEHKDLMWFFLSICSYALSFFLGGFITSLTESGAPVLNAVTVGFIVAMLSMLSVGDLSVLNTRALIMVFFGVAFAFLGGVWGAGVFARKLV
ncbi:hypothetical protein A3752_00150 [Oleiphilus sp. HI0081]|uniref:hypothetical protein n=1 Tax=unclassified Oleiphilus TaxID=2631174 RepID=UPI0007C237F6|nr:MULTISPECIES: hypothetical protein [unclassified Oleiphilus]KZY88057.1 hypothetical protein A3743_00070 [Oleiphilus sp. HI0072]KZZ11785.1 hypothetical protein A3749_08140 [Oleiphilus sp. HI0078]KZZ19770.1 hypothetical protein A3752_00150 [Oleiphilus sp. HI0081]KZY30910.1 hypothetical protein A3729_10180 [Oleiphilus sp. HI0043]KZY95962.1 hypothetical protein A3743_22915 [Oleiphilus sp. HI0072]